MDDADLGRMAAHAADDPLGLARHYLLIGNARRALAELEKAPDRLDDPQFWALRAEALFDLERWSDAREAATRGLSAEPDDATLLDVLAVSELQLGRQTEADEAIMKAIELWPENATLHAHRALILANSKRHKDAERVLAEALRLEPESPDVLRVRAQLAILRGDRRHAAEYADDVLAVEPDSDLSHLVRGGAHAERVDFKSAQRHFEEAARINPESPEIGEALREARVGAHPLLAPVRMIWRVGRWRAWAGYLAVISFLAFLRLESLRLVLGAIWITVCLLSWIGPPILRRRYERKRRVL